MSAESVQEPATEEDVQRAARRRATIRKLDVAYQPERDTYTVEQARAMIDEAITTYLDKPAPMHMLLIKAQAGTGKTTIAAHHAERIAAQGQRVFYAGPRHDFYEDLMGVARNPDMWYEWLPRQRGTTEHIETCRYADQINTWIARGYNSRGFCENPTICGKAFMKQSCRWHAQTRTDAPIIFGQHQHIVSHPLIEEAAVVFGDEWPLSALLSSDNGSAGRFVRARDLTMPDRLTGKMNPPQQAAYSTLATMIESLYALCLGEAATNGTAFSGPTLMLELGGPGAVLQAVRAYRQIAPFFDGNGPFIQGPDESDTVPVRFHGALCDLLEREASAALGGQPYIHRVRVNAAGLRLLSRRYPHVSMDAKHVIWLDATGDPRLYREMFRRPVEVIEPYVPLRGACYQITDSLNGKATLTTGGKRPSAQADRVQEQARAIIEEYGYHNPAVIGPRDILGQYQRYAQLHYYANRGTNRLQACDSVLVIGAPSPGHTAIYDMATMLFQQRMRPFPAPADAWLVEDVPFAYTDPDDPQQPGRSITTARFADRDLHTLLWQHREAEIIQAIHRVRPILHDVDVWILTNIPIDELPPTRLLTVADLFGVPARTAYLEDGTPHIERPRVDPYLWRQTRILADITVCDQGYVAPWHIVEGLRVTDRSARAYIRTLIDYCNYIEIPVTREGSKTPAVGCTRLLDRAKPELVLK